MGLPHQGPKLQVCQELVRLLVSTVGKGANLLINIGPQPNGEIPALAVDRLQGMGNWLNTYGETIYGTTAGLIQKAPWGTTTLKGNKMYVHILSDVMPEYITLSLNKKMGSVVDYDSKQKVEFQKIKNGYLIYTKGLSVLTDKILEVTLL